MVKNEEVGGERGSQPFSSLIKLFLITICSVIQHPPKGWLESLASLAMGWHYHYPQVKILHIWKFLAYPSRISGTRPSLVEHNRNTKGHKNVLLPSKSQIFQSTGAPMEQRSLWEHFPRKENAGTKTREPSGTNHSHRIYNHSVAGGEWNQKSTRRKIQAGRNHVETEIMGSMAQWGREKHQILPPFHDP